MAQEIVKEYETVEKEHTITVCDNCGRTDEESEMVTVSINPQQKVRKGQNLHLVETFDDKLEAERFILDSEKKTKSPIEHFGNNQWGVGLSHNEEIVDMKASATADVCSSCLSELFDVDVDSEEIENIRIKRGNIKVNTIEEKVSIWPDVPKWDNDRYSTVNWGWKGKIIGWPMSIIATWIERGLTDDERQKGYVAGSIGAFLWLSLLFTLVFILL